MFNMTTAKTSRQYCTFIFPEHTTDLSGCFAVSRRDGENGQVNYLFTALRAVAYERFSASTVSDDLTNSIEWV